jgi:hypothetical protein
MINLSLAPLRPHEAVAPRRPGCRVGGLFGLPFDVSERRTSHPSTLLALAGGASECSAVASSTRRTSMLPGSRPRTKAPPRGSDLDRDVLGHSAAPARLPCTFLSDAPRTARRGSRLTSLAKLVVDDGISVR